MTTGGPIDLLCRDPGDNYNIFTTMEFSQSGWVSAWSFHAVRAGEVYAAVWRPVAGLDYQLVGKNKLTASYAGKHVCFSHQLFQFIFT